MTVSGAPATGVPGAIDRGDIGALLQYVALEAGTPFLAPPLRRNVRELLLGMLAAYGVTEQAVHTRVTDKELCLMYSTANGSVTQGAKVAQSIQVRHSQTMLDPMTLKPAKMPREMNREEADKFIAEMLKQEYLKTYAPPPPPTFPVTPPPPPPSKSDSDYATKAFVREEVKQVREQTVETCLKLAEAIPETVKEQTDEAVKTAVPTLVAEALKSLTPVTLSVVLPNREPAALGMVHRKTPDIIKMLAAGVNVYLHGPAGSGKTTAGRKCAEAFGLPFYFAAKVESEYMLLGFKDARGETVRTQFREAYEHGGVFLFDELDGSSPSAVVALNAALANGICPFPDGIIVRHENFKCIGAGNTKLGGASRQYVGRAQLDAASIDRFAFVEFGYDDALETALATNAKWCEYVQAARKAVADRALPHLITPRATYDGCKLLEAGMAWSDVDDAVVWKGLDSDTVDQLVRSMDRKFQEYERDHDASLNVGIL